MKKTSAFAGVTLVLVGMSVSGASAAPAPARPAPAPLVSAVSPNRISTDGGATVTITGYNLTGADTVTIGGQPATGVTVVSSTKITAIAPAGANGPVSVTVTSPAGTSAASVRSALTYRTKLGLEVGDAVVKAAGGSLTLEVTGGTLGATAKEFAAERITLAMGKTPLRMSYVDAQHLKVTIPAVAADQAELTVVHDSIAGEPAAVDVAPVVTALSVREDTVLGGRKTVVRVAGANIAEASSFTFGEAAAECVTKGRGAGTTFECVVPAAEQAGPVVVSFTSGSGKASRFTAAGTFVYTD